MRVMRDVFESFLNMGPVSQVHACVWGDGGVYLGCSGHPLSCPLSNYPRTLTLTLKHQTPTPPPPEKTQIMGMIPGFNADMFGGGASGDRQSSLQIKRYITIIESMTDKELDTTNLKILSEPTRIDRLARGSGGFLFWGEGGLIGGRFWLRAILVGWSAASWVPHPHLTCPLPLPPDPPPPGQAAGARRS
jgi:hypothetical protein